MDFMQLPLMDVNMLTSWSVCFHTGLKPSHADTGTLTLISTVAKILLENSIPTRGIPLEFHID